MQVAGAVIREAGLVAAAGLAFALGANALSPRGLDLWDLPPLTTAGSPEQDRSAENLVRKDGFTAVTGAEVAEIFRHPGADPGVVFVDARNDEDYRGGHIPGSLQLDPYRPESYLAAALPACLAATKIVVYCHGETCEDSRAAATLLREAGVPAASIFVYTGGIDDWTKRKMPLARP